MRVVLDCNVYISALLKPDGPCGRILARLVEGTFDCILTPAILEEVRRALFYPKVRRGLPSSDDELEALLAALSVLSSWVEDEPAGEVIVGEDPDDDIYLRAAVKASAHAIVSGDSHLLRLKEYQGIPIVGPRAFLEMRK